MEVLRFLTELTASWMERKSQRFNIASLVRFSLPAGIRAILVLLWGAQTTREVGLS